MPSTDVGGMDWGQIFGSIIKGGDPWSQGQARGIAAQKHLLDAEELRRLMSAREGAIDAFNTRQPFTTDPNRTPIVGPVQPGEPSLEADWQTRKSAAEQAYDRAQIQLGLRTVKSTSDVSEQMPKILGQNYVRQFGVPAADTPAYGTVQTQLEGKLAKPLNPFENEATMVQGLHVLNQKALAAADGTSPGLTRKEIEIASVLRERLHPTTTDVQTINGRPTEVTGKKTPIPPAYQYLSNLIDDYRAKFAPGRTPPVVNPDDNRPVTGLLPVADGPSPVAGMPVPPTPPMPTTTGAGVTAPPPAAAGAAPAAAAAPIVPPDAAQRVGGFGLKPIGPMDFMKIAEEVKTNQIFKEYATSSQNWGSFVEYLKHDSKAADIGLIFAAAKILDPPSVVRGPEGEMIRGTSPISERLSTMINEINGGARLGKNGRANLATMVYERVQGDYNVFGQEVQRYHNIGKVGGLEPEQVGSILPGLGAPKQFDLKEINKYAPIQMEKIPRQKQQIDPRQAGAMAPRAAPATAPAPGGRTIRVNPQTGAIEEAGQ